MKKCKRCERELPLSDYTTDRSTRDKLSRYCRACLAEMKKRTRAKSANREHEREYNRAYYAAHRERRLQDAKDWYRENRDQALAEDRRAYWADPERARKRVRDWYWENRESRAAYFQERYADPAYREKAKAARRRYYRENRERCLEAGRQWFEANQTPERLERARSRARKWAIENPERRRQHHAQRRQRKRAPAGLPFTLDQLAQRMAYFGDRCWMCGGPFEHVDHVKPLAKGGLHILANLRPACASCNQSKSARWPLEVAS